MCVCVCVCATCIELQVQDKTQGFRRALSMFSVDFAQTGLFGPEGPIDNGSMRELRIDPGRCASGYVRVDVSIPR